METNKILIICHRDLDGYTTIATKFGGGGHAGAAGFSTPII